VKKSLSIRTQLIASVVIMTFAAISFIGVLSISLVRGNAITGRVHEANRVGSLLRASLEDVFVQGSSDGSLKSRSDIKERSLRLMRSASIGALRIKDNKGRVVFSVGPMPDAKRRVETKEPSRLLFFDNGIRISSVGESGWFKGPGRLLYVEVRQKPGTKKLFTASFTLSLYDIAAYLASMRTFIIIFGVVDSIIIIALGLYFLSAIVMRPIRRLEATAARIAGGDLNVRAEVVSGDEIGRLALRFNTMADMLGEEIARLGRVNVQLRDTQAELLRAGALAAVGSLAAGLAHEIGNPLGAVSGYVDILGKWGSGGAGETKEEQAEMLRRANKELERMDKILREFLDIARPTTDEPVRVDVNALIEETVLMFGHHSRGKGIDVRLELYEENLTVVTYEDKLRQVFTNLLLNAADAMDAKGVIVVESRPLDVPSTAASEVNASEVRVRKGDTNIASALERKTRKVVAITFKDSGCGISKQDLERVFDPFFTTKDPGKGTGLGLFISASMMKACGGTIEVTSEEGKGSTFTVIL
jgi:hypothetical protein